MQNKPPPGVSLLREPGLMVRIADELDITSSSVRMWRKVPLRHLLNVERITGIPREKLRPDLAKLFGRRGV